MVELKQLCIPPTCSIRKAMACIDRNAKGIALVVDGERRLIATITDGDIRRAILAHISMDVPVTELLERKSNSPYPEPTTAKIGTESKEILQLMRERIVRQVPLLDKDGRVVDLVTMDELLPDQLLPLRAVIMAGGLGSRLRSLTKELPKPMLPVGDRPLMELIIKQLRQAGIQRVNITTHYQSEKITSYFGDGKEFGVDIQYVSENKPLGTAGAVGLIEKSDQPILVINGDILTDVDFKAMHAFHQEHNADLTVGVRQYDLQVPYGVIETQGVQVKQLDEKPIYSFFVNAGIYLLEPDVRQFIPNGEKYDMTELIERLIIDGRPVISFPIIEYWLDIGELGDYRRAQEDLENGRMKY